MKSRLLLAAGLAVALGAGAAVAAPAAYIMAAVADKGRPADDTARDAARKPAEMLDFAGVKPGMTVVDLLPGRGYFTRIFSKAVGPKGTVYALSPPVRPPQDPSKPPPPPPIDQIAADTAYGNVKSMHGAITGVSIPTKADVVWTSQNYHDVKNAPNVDMLAFNKSIYDALKPGGVYIVLDHAANPGVADATSKLHRVDPAVVKQEVTAAGFKFEGESDVLRNPQDDRNKRVFEAGEHDHTDQFILKFRKPK